MITLNDIILPASVNIAMCGTEIGVLNFGNANELIKFHSAAKPFQSLCFLRQDYKNLFALTESERVMFASSHFGQDIHITALESIMNKAGISEEQLIVPYSEPLGMLAKDYWRKFGISNRKLFHQCSGNHLGFIIRSKEMNTDERTYHLPNSLAQREALDIIERFIKRTNIDTTPDNCGIPTYYVSLAEIASAYLDFITIEPFAADLLRRHAVYVEGDGALSTELMKKYCVVAKSSTNGVIAIGYFPAKVGIAIKASNWDDLWKISQTVISIIGEIN